MYTNNGGVIKRDNTLCHRIQVTQNWFKDWRLPMNWEVSMFNRHATNGAFMGHSEEVTLHRSCTYKYQEAPDTLLARWQTTYDNTSSLLVGATVGQPVGL